MSEVAVAEPEVIQAEAPAQEQPPIDPADAATPVADAGAETTTSTEPLSVDDYVAAQLQKEGTQAQPESTPEPQVDYEALRMADEARNRFQNAHRSRQERLDALNEKVEAGDISYAEATRQAKDILNEHHADSLRDAGYLTGYETNRAVWLGIERAIPQEHHETIAKKLSEGKYASGWDAVASDLYGLGVSAGETKGYEAGRKAGLTQGYQDGLAQAGKVAALSSDGQQVNGTGASGGSYKTVTDLNTDYANDKITTATYRAEHKRLTGREP